MRRPSTPWLTRPLAVAALACGALMLLASHAFALSGTPLAITDFKVHTTERTEEREVFGTGGYSGAKGLELVNKPYVFTQAGGHPWGLTTTIEFATEPCGSEGHETCPTRDPKDAVVTIPLGLVGNPTAMPRCPLSLVFSGSAAEQCPADTQVGDYLVQIHGGNEFEAPVVNVIPERGQSAEFALENTAPILVPLLTAHLVRTTEHTPAGGTREAYGLQVVSAEIPNIGLYKVELTFWGVPADPSHDPMRGRFCRRASAPQGEPLKCDASQDETGNRPAGVAQVPFLSLPTSCTAGPGTARLRVDSYQEPGSVSAGGRYSGFIEATAPTPAVTGCDVLSFQPAVETQPDTLLADSPVGLDVNVKVPQPEQPGIDATPHLRDALVTLPAGMSVSAGIVDGIKACDATGPEGINIPASEGPPNPESEEVGQDGEWHLAPGRCPDASTVGTAEAITPLLSVPVKGHVYLARPGCGGVGQAACTEQDALDGNLFKLYLELGGTGEFANTGINIKVPGEVEANPATGQLTTKFLGNPQLPFSELRIHLNGGPRAPIANPPTCGPALTTSDFTPWSAPGTTPPPESLQVAGTPDATPSSSFNAEGCPNPTPFAPGFVAGTVTPQAGDFSAFTLNLSRADREQYVKGIQVHTPPGLLGMLSSVALCEEPQAAVGSCAEGSRIGTTRVASGAGSHPFEIEGNVYLTKGYGGAPFGLSVVTNAVAGPYDLGKVVVRARINVDPVASTLTITTDETGPHAIPQILFGVPLRLKQVTVNIDRPGFMFNPTNCGAPGQPGIQQVTANVSGNQNAVANVSSSFAVGGCKSLDFKPRFQVSTSGHTSKAKGASLDAKVSYPPFKAGSEANIAYVKVALPKQLPSRLTTLQKACPDATFNANPAGCPSASIIGIVRTSTPLLPVGLEGPVYFVSHGGEAFPSLIAVLQGDGVRVDLTGTTFISKSGITSSTFKTVPDVPVNIFEIYLPEGKFSALTANGNLCKVKGGLKMPSEFVAQNGAVIKQSTQIAVTGCPKAKARKAHRARRASHRQRGSRR
jgi:hypothetical protein